MELNELLEESQFHGGRRLAERKCRWLWSIAMLVLFGSSVAVVCVTVRRYLDNPTFIVNLETVEHSMKFPSVLVCPEIFYRDDKIERFLSHMDIPPHLNLTYLRNVIRMLGAFVSPDIGYKAHHLHNIEQLLEANSMDVDTAGRLLVTSCEKTLIRCRWQGVIVNCSSLFHMELTGVGYCCVFNGRSLNRDLGDGLYNKKQHRKWYTNHFGHNSGLMLVVNQSQTISDVDLSYKWLALETSQHFVESTVNGSALNPGSEHWVEYRGRYFQIAEEARSLSNTLRKCRISTDPLKFFPVYSKKYCIVECEVAETLKRCNCIRLVHPRPKGAPYCNAHQLRCAKHAMVSYGYDACSCPLACDVAIDYVKISNFNLLPSIRPVDPFYDGLNFSKVTVARIFVISRKVKTESRWSYFNNMDLFSQLGGVFNVFFGCSILTLLELGIIVYRGFTSKVPAKTNPQSNQELGKESKKSRKNDKNKLEVSN